MASFVRITYDDGGDEWELLTESTATSLFGLEMAYPDIPPCTFAEFGEEDYYRAKYTNLDRVAAIEIPSDRYHRLTSPSEA